MPREEGQPGRSDQRLLGRQTMIAEAGVMDDWKAGFEAELRAMAIANGDAASAQLPDLLRRLSRHQAGLGGNPVLSLYRRWRIRRLGQAVAEARWHAEQGRLARLGGLDPRP